MLPCLRLHVLVCLTIWDMTSSFQHRRRQLAVGCGNFLRRGDDLRLCDERDRKRLCSCTSWRLATGSKALCLYLSGTEQIESDGRIWIFWGRVGRVGRYPPKHIYCSHRYRTLYQLSIVIIINIIMEAMNVTRVTKTNTAISLRDKRL